MITHNGCLIAKEAFRKIFQPSTTLQIAGLKYFALPIKYEDIPIPIRPKLPFMDKVSKLPANIRPPKIQKRLRYMRGPESPHNTKFQHGQYGIVSLQGGRLKWGHLEMIRLTLGRKIDPQRMYACWRVDPPWQPVTRKGQGQRMGGGKGAIDHYVTPLKAGRVIIEVWGRLEYVEVKDVLENIAQKLPFKAMAASQGILDELRAKEEWQQSNNLNPYTMKYVVQNNLGGCHNWLKPIDFKCFGKYV